MAQVVAVTARRVARLLAARGLGPGADPDECDPLVCDEPLLVTLAAASLRGRIATGPRAGQRLLLLGDRVEPNELGASGLPTEPCCASEAGFSLAGAVAVPARDRQRLQRLCRYVARPPLATDRLTKRDDGHLCYRLKRRWRDGTKEIVLDPVAFLERLAGRVVSLAEIEVAVGASDPLFDAHPAAVLRPDRYVFGVVDDAWELNRLVLELGRKLALS